VGGHQGIGEGVGVEPGGEVGLDERGDGATVRAVGLVGEDVGGWDDLVGGTRVGELGLDVGDEIGGR
jgi:hypothetical protein